MRKCPKCGVKYKSYPAISRKDNKTEICPRCGEMEALKDFRRYLEDGTRENLRK